MGRWAQAHRRGTVPHEPLAPESAVLSIVEGRTVAWVWAGADPSLWDIGSSETEDGYYDWSLNVSGNLRSWEIEFGGPWVRVKGEGVAEVPSNAVYIG